MNLETVRDDEQRYIANNKKRKVEFFTKINTMYTYFLLSF